MVGNTCEYYAIKIVWANGLTLKLTLRLSVPYSSNDWLDGMLLCLSHDREAWHGANACPLFPRRQQGLQFWRGCLCLKYWHCIVGAGSVRISLWYTYFGHHRLTPEGCPDCRVRTAYDAASSQGKGFKMFYSYVLALLSPVLKID